MTTSSTSPLVHWTTFAADSTGADFTDHRAAHSAVMRLFPSGLDTCGAGQSHGRSVADILFRVDVLGTERHVLVQSRVAPVALPDGARTMALTSQRWAVTAEAQIRLRVAVNPIVRNGRTRSERILSADESVAWLTERLTGALSHIDVACHSRDVWRQSARPAETSDTLTIDTFDATATVADPNALDLLRLGGVGRRKAYGAGLLTVQRLG